MQEPDVNMSQVVNIVTTLHNTCMYSTLVLKGVAMRGQSIKV